MKVYNIASNMNFKNTQAQTHKKKNEFIDSFLDVVKNQDDINDCVAVPRGIFKAYLWIMGGFGLIGIGSALPKKLTKTKTTLGVVGNICNMISAFYFAKPFAFKDVSPTVKKQNKTVK